MQRYTLFSMWICIFPSTHALERTSGSVVATRIADSIDYLLSLQPVKYLEDEFQKQFHRKMADVDSVPTSDKLLEESDEMGVGVKVYEEEAVARDRDTELAKIQNIARRTAINNAPPVKNAKTASDIHTNRQWQDHLKQAESYIAELKRFKVSLADHTSGTETDALAYALRNTLTGLLAFIRLHFQKRRDIKDIDKMIILIQSMRGMIDNFEGKKYAPDEQGVPGMA